jgi:hypothetical protein
MFELNKDYSRENIHQTVGGNKESFLPAYRGKIVAACLRPDLNPRAPEYIVCNSGGRASCRPYVVPSNRPCTGIHSPGLGSIPLRRPFRCAGIVLDANRVRAFRAGDRFDLGPDFARHQVTAP